MSSFVTRPRGEAMEELRKRGLRPPVDLADYHDPQSLDEIVSEWRLNQGATRSRPCACGTDIVANPNDPEPGVRAHRQTPAHRSWAERTFDDGPPSPVTVRRIE